MHYLRKQGDFIGRCFVAVAMIAFGVQHLIYGDFVTRVAPKLPAVIPAHSFLAFVFGAYLIVSGFSLFFHKTARTAGLLLAAVLLASLGLLYLPALVATPGDMALWTKAGKALTFCGAALLIAESLPGEPQGFEEFRSVVRPLEKLIPFARYFLAAFFAFCGVLHFIYVDFVVGLVPTWIPGPIFWTYFSGAALVASGLGISIPLTTRFTAGLSALMVFLWVLMLHIPRALANLRDSNETTAVFEATAVAGTALLVAFRPLPSHRKQCPSRVKPVALTANHFVTVPNPQTVPSGPIKRHRYEATQN